MKRIISAFLILIMIIPPMVLPAAADGLVPADSVVRIIAEKTGGSAGDKVTVGDTVTVTVAFENIPACGAVDLNLVYDTEYLQEPAESDVKWSVTGFARSKNPAFIIDEKTSQEYAGRQAVKVAAANGSNCLMGSSGTLFTVKFVVANEAPAPGIPLEFFGTFSDLYSNQDLGNTIQVVNTHIATANPTKEVTSVSLKQEPTKTQYVQGQALNLEGGRLLVDYNDGSSQEVYLSLAQITQYEFNKLGTQTVEATYAKTKVSFEIQTEESVFYDISIGQVPTTVEYILGTAELNRKDGVLLLHYTGGIVKTLDMKDNSVTLSGYNKDTLGVQEIEVQYGDFKAKYKITVVSKPTSDIDVRTPMVCGACGAALDAFKLIKAADASVDPYSMKFGDRLTYIAKAANNVTCLEENCEGKTFTPKMKMSYFVGEDFDVGNATLFVTYSDGTTEEIPMELGMVEFKNNIATTQSVEVVYGEQSMLIKDVRTRNKEATEISVVQKPKTEYVKGQPFDPTGGIVHVKYDDGSEEDLPMNHEDIRLHYTGMDVEGEHKVTVFYENQQAYFKIKVIARVVKSIAVDSEANSTYIQGQPLNLDTKLLVTYNDEKTETAYLRNATVEGYNSEQIGLQVLTITYGGVNCNWPVTVEEKVVTALEVVGTLPTTVLEETELNLEGCTLTATYNEGKLVEENIAIKPEMIQFNAQVGTQTVTLSYKEGTVTFEITVLEKSLTSIEVEGVKEQYLLMDALDRSVGKIKLIYNNGTVDYIDFSDEAVSVEGFQSNVAGEQLVTVEYQGFTDTYPVTVYIDIQSISVTPPKKTVYKEGEPLNLAEGFLHITQPNGTIDVPLSEGMFLEPYDPDRIGEQTLTITVGEHTADFKVTVREKQLTGITVSPETIDHNEWEELDLSQVVVTAWYDNNTSKTVTEEASKAAYDTYVIYTYEGKTATLNVNVIKRAPIFIEWAEEPQKRTYFAGDPLLKDGTIRVHYNDQTNEQLPLTDENVSIIGDTNVEGTQTVYVKTVYVKYNDLSPISFEITVVPVVVEKIEITTEPERSYIEGQPLNVAGGMILITYNNEDTEPLAMNAAGVTLSGYDPNKVGEQTVTVTYGGKTATFTVNVRARKAVRISISTRPKTEYLEGKDTALNLAGGKLTVYYDNNTSAIINLTDSKVTVSGFKKEVGTHTITVTYQGLQTSFHIVVRPKEVIGIAIAAMPTKMMYRQGVEKFDPAGGKLTVFYNNDTKETVNLSKAKISGFSNLFAGDVTFTASYEGYSAELTVLILAESPFMDIKETDYFETPVLWAVTKGITNGTKEDTFSPDADCTRGQIVTFLWRSAGSPEPKTTKNPFKDVKPEDYYYKAVLWAVENGITTGTSATTFSPDAGCTRGQVATFLWRANDEPSAANSKNPFTDLKNGEYYYDAVLWAAEKGITNGTSATTSATTFSPDATCTRGQIVTFLYRAELNR